MKQVIETVTQDIALIRHFREHLAVLSDQRALDLLSLASVTQVTNKDARDALKLRRAGAWVWLSKLTRLGMLEKRGQGYRASPYAANLVSATSLVFRSVLNGKMPQLETNAWSEVIHLASEGVRMSYERGKIDQVEYTRQGRMLKELEEKLNVS